MPSLGLTPGSRIGGTYEVVEQIGIGGMGVVYKVREHVGGVSRIRALKTILPHHLENQAIRDRFREEAEKMCLLEHENILPVLSYNEEGGFPYLVMPFIEGQTLKEYLGKYVAEHRGGLPLPQVIEIGLQLVYGLEAAHGFVNPSSGRPQPIIHRDIKPGNIMVRLEDRGGEQRLKVLIMDFGIAKLKAEDDAGMTLTDVIGTVKYAAPEQVQRWKQIDPRADIYSLGMVLYEMYCGRHLFGRTGEHAVLMRLMQKDLEENRAEFPPGTPEAFRRLIERAIAIKRDDRFAKVGDLLPLMRQSLEEEARRRLGEVRDAEARAIQARSEALQRRLDSLAPQSLAAADALVQKATQAENAGEFTKALSLFSEAASAFEQGVRQAEIRAGRDQLESRLAAVGVLRSAAVAAGAERFARGDFDRAERATTAAERLLRSDGVESPTAILGTDGRPLAPVDDLTAIGRLLDTAEAGWRKAEEVARSERAISEIAEKRGAIERDLGQLLAAVERLPADRRAPEMERLVAAVKTELGRPAKGEPDEILARLDDCRVTLESALRMAHDALDRVLAEKSTAALQRSQAVAAGLETLSGDAQDEWKRVVSALERAKTPGETVRRLDEVEGAERELRNLEAAIAEEAARRAAAEREAEARAKALRAATEVARREAEKETASDRSRSKQRLAEEAWRRGEARFADRRWSEALEAYEIAVKEFQAAATAARDDAAKPPAEEALGRLRRATALVAELGSRKGDEGTEHARLLRDASQAEPFFSRGEFAAAAPLLRDTADAMERLADRIRRRQETERVADELNGLRRRVGPAVQELESLADAGAASAARAFRGRLASAEEIASRGDGAAAIEALRAVQRDVTEELASARQRIERERAHEAALRAKRDAEAAAARSRELGGRATEDPTFVHGVEELGRAEALLAEGDYSAADRTFTQLTRTFAGLAQGIEAKAREERQTALLGRAETLRLELADLPQVRELRRTRKVAETSLTKAEALLRSGDATGAETALELCTAVLAKAPSARHEPFAPAPPKWSTAKLAGLGAIALVLLAVVWIAVRSATKVAPGPDVVPTVQPTARSTVAPTAVATVRPTIAPTMAPTTVPTAVFARPAGPVLGSVSPAASSLKIAIGDQPSFDAKLKSGDPNAIEWELDGSVVRRGSTFVLDKTASGAPGDHRVAMIGRAAGEEVFRREWRVKVAPQPLQWANLQPRDRVEGEVGQTYSFSAALNGAPASELSYRWQVNGVDQKSEGATFQLAAREPGTYDVKVRAEASWERSAEHGWKLLVKAPAPPALPTPAHVGPPVAEVEAWVKSFCDAYQRKDVTTLSALGQFKNEEQADAARGAFKALHDLKVSCTKPSITFKDDDEATVSFTRSDTFLDDQQRSHSGEIPYRSLPLRRVNGKWVKGD